jgi:hypothetical protein
MRKTRVSKLKLSRETVRNLQAGRLAQAVGGRILNKDDTSNWGCTETGHTGTGCNTYQCTAYCTD